MTTPTYSLGLTGTKAHNPFVPKVITMPDTSASGVSLQTGFGALQGIMQDGDQLLCKHQDGQMRWYRIDAERSSPGNIVLLLV
jgi:hypothetical protein